MSIKKILDILKDTGPRLGEVFGMKQESLKNSTKEIPAHVIDQLNNIYEQGIGICKIAAKYYHGNKVKKEQFTFDSVMKKVDVQYSKESVPGGATQPK